MTGLSSRGTVVVIGAGVAGLAAAKVLQDSGLFKVIVLEARNRISGRVNSFTDSFGYSFEEGANWVHGDSGNPLTPLCKQLGIVLKPTPDELPPAKYLFDQCGRRMRRTQRRKLLARRYKRMIRHLHERAEGRGASIQSTFDEWISRAGANHAEEQYMQHLLTLQVEEFAADACDVALADFIVGSEYAGPDLFVCNGYNAIAHHLAKDLDIRLATAAERIVHGPNGVTIDTASGTSFRADQLIVTVPLGVLKQGSIEFAPSLPDWKLSAIESAGMGQAEKLFLNFKQRFCPGDLTMLEKLPSNPRGFHCYLNIEPLTGSSTLMGFIVGAGARQLVHQSLDEVVRSALSEIGSAMAPLPELLWAHKTAWSSDRFAGGSYPFPQVGKSFDLRLIGRSVGQRLHFAGDACQDDSYGYVHSALLSGRRVARKLVRRERTRNNLTER